MDIKENSVHVLYRRGQEEHIKALYEKGELYINTIEHIRRCDQNNDRSDLYDGISDRLFLGDVKIKLCDVGLDIEKYGRSFDGVGCVITTDSIDKGNIYCLSGIYKEHLEGERNNIEFNTKSFGESLIVIHNPTKFIERILQALKNDGFENVQYSAVTYYLDDYSGPVGFFMKHERFSTQNEFRIFIPNKINSPIKISIGSLKDIAFINKNCFIELVYTDEKKQIIKIL